jgi:hypothetical protein
MAVFVILLSGLIGMIMDLYCGINVAPIFWLLGVSAGMISESLKEK